MSAGEGLQKYFYYKYTIKGTVLYAYELSHDTTDILYCIYNEHNQMIATISKKTTVVHGHARYTIYSCNEEWFKYAAILTTCWSICNTEEDGSAMSITKKTEVTINPELLSKYNPTFINQVKQKEGKENLPENMDLVTQKIDESKKSSDVKLSKVLLIITFTLIIGIIIFSLFKVR